MNEIIYLETSEEITGVIDRLRATESSAVCFVIPRGATIAQSIVNLKLLKKSAGEMGKEISLIATDRISRNLASQIGLTVYSKVSEAERAKPKEKAPVLPKAEEIDHEEESSGQFKVNNYYRNKRDDLGEDEEEIKNELKEMAEKEEEPAEEVEMSSRPISEHVVRESDSSHEPVEETPKDEPEKKRLDHIDRVPPKKESMKFQSNIGRPANIKGSRKPIIFITSVAVLVLVILGYLFLPYTTVAVQIKTSDFSADKQVTIDRNAKEKNTDKLVLPGTLLEQEKEMTKTFDATGKKDIGEKAAGTLTFSNTAGVDDSIAAGATVKSLNGGIEFTLDQAVTVPKATASVNASGQVQLNPGKATGKVTAKDPGDKGNLPAGSNFSVSGKSLMSAAGQTSGGVSREIKVVTSADLDKAEDGIKKDVSDTAKNDLLELAKKDKLSIFDDSAKSEIVSSTASKNEGDEADKFDYTVKVKLFAIAFVKSDLDNIIIDNINSGLGGDKMLVNPEKSDIKYDLKDNNVDTGVLTVEAKFSGKQGQKISDTDVKKQVKGKTVSKARDLISKNSGVEKVEVTNWPKVMPEIPWLTKRIKVVFDYAK